MYSVRSQQHQNNNKQKEPNNDDYFLVKQLPAPDVYDEHHEEEDIISVRYTLIIAGYLGCAGMSIFAIVLVMMANDHTGERQEAKYISEGMEAHCGWSVVVLGLCSFIIFLCQLVAGVHMNRHAAVLFAFLEVVGWCVVLGIVDTGWMFHYVGLTLFLIGNIGYHWIASRDYNYGSMAYQWSNLLTILFTCVFCSTALASMLARDLREVKALAVGLEFVLLFFSMTENLMLMRALDSYENIHLVFEKKR
jgi:hypothetical protein